MGNAILFHGTGGAPDSCWLPYVKNELEERGYMVQVPRLPHADAPVLAEQLAFALEHFSYDADTVLIGHSAGVPLILSILERVDACIHEAVLVAGFFEPLNPPEPEQMLQSSYDWKRIREHCARFVVINSDNDPWGCTDAVGRRLAEYLGGEFVLSEGQGHMGSMKFNQPYREFSMLLEVIA